MNKGTQYFSKEYLKRYEKVTPDQIIEFLENYRMLLSITREKSQWIRLIHKKVEESAT
jgi:hypothetical protein